MDSKQALAELQNFQKSRKSTGDYYTQFQDELGVGAAKQGANDVRGLIRNTESALKGVNASVAGRTRGQNINEAQRARLEGLERAPIAEELGTLQGSYSDQMQDYRDLLGQATTRTGQSYQTDADRLSSLESNYNKIYQTEQDAAEQARLQREMDERRRQFEAEMSQRDRQFNANLAATKARAASYSMPTTVTSNNNDARMKAIAAEVARLSQPKAAPIYQGNKKVVDKGGLGGLLKQGMQNVFDYGPLALFGGGSLWR